MAGDRPGDHRLVRWRHGLVGGGDLHPASPVHAPGAQRREGGHFELDVNLATITVAREHGLFVDLDRSAFERLLPELATLLDAPALKTVVGAYMTHAGYRQSRRATTCPPTSGPRR